MVLKRPVLRDSHIPVPHYPVEDITWNVRARNVQRSHIIPVATRIELEIRRCLLVGDGGEQRIQLLDRCF